MNVQIITDTTTLCSIDHEIYAMGVHSTHHVYAVYHQSAATYNICIWKRCYPILCMQEKNMPTVLQKLDISVTVLIFLHKVTAME